MIAGLLPITSGEVRVMGMSCTEDIVFCRQRMSLCPQENPMYESVTVNDHLHFFASLRGSQNQQHEVTSVLEALGISEKRGAKCGTLSGGQKRRLWVATSLLGKAPLVFLDEPTSGMDPSSRRELWTLLLGMKRRGRSILFTTHYLEEADLLADRKAVIAKGKVKGIGTSKELKKQFGTGYHLRIMTPRTSPASVLDQLTEVVVGTVSGATKEEVPHVERSQSADAPMEVRYALPSDEIGTFGNLFLSLEARTAELQVLDFELAATSLEEVFMRLGKEDVEAEADGDGVVKEVAEFQDLEQEVSAGSTALSDMEYAKLLFSLRTTQTLMNKKVLFGTVVFPLFFSLFAMIHTTKFFSLHKMMQNVYAIYPGLIAAVACMRLPYTLIEERELKITQVMISMGMPRKVYLYTTLGHNALQVLVVTLCSPIILALGGETCLDRGRWLFAGLAALLHVVPLSIFFFVVSCYCKSAENANKILNLLNVIFGMLWQILPSLLWNFEQDEMPDVLASWIHSLSSFFSPYYLLPGVLTGVWQAGGGDAYKCSYVTVNHTYAHECFKVPEDAGLGYFMGTWVFWAPWAGQTFLCAVMGMLAYRFTSTENDRQSNSNGPPVNFSSRPEGNADEDVRAEEERVRTIASPEQEACLYRNLHHVFPGDKTRSNVHAVRGISLGIQHGECFGLLGPNGAGKTTTLGCLTGEIRPPTAGEVYVAGHSVSGPDAEKAFKHLGYCPQVDPLWADLTGRQHLAYYGKMKGAANGKLDGAVDSLFQRLGFEVADRDKRAGTYSGGMKRKLALAIALIGPTDVLFLDEPSAAVDACAKRLLWQAIKMRAKTKTVIITTHSMEEAEAVCDRIGIQVHGSLRCLGTPIHLKLKYGSGYQMEIRLKLGGGEEEPDKTFFGSSEELTEFVKGSLSSGATLLEAHEATYLYQLPPFKVGESSLGQVFKGLQEASATYAIEQYSLVQPSLEQVFLRFAKEQQEAMTGAAEPEQDEDMTTAGYRDEPVRP
jgi:ABC-type multidrug transport system ATPase subunit